MRNLPPAVANPKKKRRGLKESAIMLKGDALLGNDNAADLLRLFQEANLPYCCEIKNEKVIKNESERNEEETEEEENEREKHFVQNLIAKGEAGDGEAQFALGYMYRKGILFEEDDEKACYWLKKSADGGNSNGQCSMGVMYYWGKGVPKDHVKVLFSFFFSFFLLYFFLFFNLSV